MIQSCLSKFSNNKLRFFLPVMVLMIVVSCGVAKADSASITVTPDTGLTNGQSVTITGSGLAANTEGAIVECNSDANQPTVTAYGNSVPVSCSNPVSNLVSTDANGNLTSTTFSVIKGTVGPPATGKDSLGNSATADAALYPCPPTAAQIAAGDTCQIEFGDASGDNPMQTITFAGQTQPSSGNNSQDNSSNSNSSNNNNNQLVNTGPGNVIGLAIVVSFIAALGYFGYNYKSQKA